MKGTIKQGLTVTFCDRGENHIHNQQIGALATEGFTYVELEQSYLNLCGRQITTDLYNLGNYLPAQYKIHDTYDAGLLVIRDGLSLVSDKTAAYNELLSLTYDSKAIMYGQLRNKIARHNLCFADFDQQPDYEKGKGTVVSFDRLPELSKLRAQLPLLLNSKATNLVAEANYYYDVNSCGIGYHGDKERKIVVGVRYGNRFPFCFYWYLNGERISPRIDISLNHGDIYVMDEKACGNDAARRLIPTLRHAAGCAKYTN